MHNEQVLIVFGATGDLMKKKIAPALLKLFSETIDAYPTKVIAVGRTPYTSEKYRAYVKDSLCELFGVCSDVPETFFSRFEYVEGSVDTPALFTALASTISPNAEVLAYCSLGCDKYDIIAQGLDTVGLVHRERWTGIVLEKPHGYNLETFKTLVLPVIDRYGESRVFLIEHYFAKDLVQYLLDFRFKESHFESVWNAAHIASIDIHLWEDVGVEKRGAFYDTVGAYRDMGQNHVTQLLAIICMRNPHEHQTSVEAERAAFVNTLPLLSRPEIQHQVERYQYAGYQSIQDVAPDSKKETAFILAFSLREGVMSGVQVFCGSGKRIAASPSKEMVITFKDGVLDPRDKTRKLVSITFSLQPFEGIIITTHNGTQIQEERLEPTKRVGERIQYIGEYTKILRGALAHSQQYFVHADEVRGMWRFADQFTAAFERDQIPLLSYEKNSTTVLDTYEALVKKGAASPR